LSCAATTRLQSVQHALARTSRHFGRFPVRSGQTRCLTPGFVDAAMSAEGSRRLNARATHPSSLIRSQSCSALRCAGLDQDW
jgi:hypothetical protein